MKKYAIIPLKDMVLFSPGTIQIKLDHTYGQDLQTKINEHDGYAIGLSLKQSDASGKYNIEDFYNVGNLGKIESIKKEKDQVKLTIKLLERVVVNPEFTDGLFQGSYETLLDLNDMDLKSQEDIMDYINRIAREMGQSIPGSESFIDHLQSLDNINAMIASLMPYFPLSLEEKQGILEMTSLRKKSLRFLDIMIERKEQLRLQIELSSKFSDSMNEVYRERMLREQLKSIQDELSKKEGKKKDYRQMISEKKLSDSVREIAEEELDKLDRSPNGPEANVIRNYLDLILALPWHVSEEKDIDIDSAKLTLDQAHYGLEKVKERVIQHLAVMKLKRNRQGSIVLLVGPPGTGKTSLAASIAKALDRKYIRSSLGGVRDEAEIRGHRRTYIGAMPGKIIQGMKRAGTTNPVFVLDEIDKLMVGGSGDPASALLEVLDPEQNNSFNDHYLDLPYDLSDVFFIATANDLRTIPGPLRDRMEIIQIGSYTSNEKYHIASKHLFKKSLEDHGLSQEDIKLSDNSLKAIIDHYTREAGVRNLKRQLDKLVRISGEKLVTGKVNKPYRIRENMLAALLGRPPFRYDRVDESNLPGVVTGLAWTPVGGDILFIESAFMPGSGQLILTGQLGDVMKESARISLSLVKSRLHTFMTPEQLRKLDLHIHVPAGAIPKDGPSAGVTILTTIASLITNRPVDSKLAMTGEVSLRGQVLAVGGIKEKIIAAHRSGIRKVLLPFDNQYDLEDIPSEIKQEMTFVFIQTVEELIKNALNIELPEPLIHHFDRDTSEKSEIGFSMKG